MLLAIYGGLDLLVASWIVAVLFSPLIGTWILTTNVKGHHGEGLFTRTFRRLLDVCLPNGSDSMCSLAVAVFGVSIWGSSKLQQQFFPPSDRPELLVNVNLPQSATIESTLVQAQKVEALLQDDENIDRTQPTSVRARFDSTCPWMFC